MQEQEESKGTNGDKEEKKKIVKKHRKQWVAFCRPFSARFFIAIAAQVSIRCLGSERCLGGAGA